MQVLFGKKVGNITVIVCRAYNAFDRRKKVKLRTSGQFTYDNEKDRWEKQVKKTGEVTV